MAVLALTLGSGAEVGSKVWCEDLQEKAKGEWTENWATEFAKS
ncbi:MAG: hypothetical protein CMQ29_02605 [Gammaproteobacteria bacterium]|nr:hypothetical protein [Gammaproteobacteria bacterium]